MTTKPRIEAVGRDFSRYLPGLFWRNYFGPPYCDLIGLERLVATPTANARKVGDGVELGFDFDPKSWDTPAYRSAQERAGDWLGRDFFFDRNDPARPTRAPNWDERSRAAE